MSYLRKLFQTGAIRKTPPSVIAAILAEVRPLRPVRIVEFGAGQGEITYPLLRQVAGNCAAFQAFELDRELGAALEHEAKDVQVLYEDAFHFSSFLPDGAQVDHFICALPLSFHPRKKTLGLLQAMRARLAPGGSVVLIFNAFWLLPTLRKGLPGGRLRVFPTFPVYGMFVYRRVDA
ncbi:MAG: hypothetical protein EOO11_04305 [Chitinophagaceae bacterium]|nr:MAG: hypothetical protein EOO11_04305 [Chitinophagaceae bacterium]